jgi:hypothetical protein
MEDRNLYYTSKSLRNKIYVNYSIYKNQNQQINQEDYNNEKSNNKNYYDMFSQLENLRKKKEQELNKYIVRSQFNEYLLNNKNEEKQNNTYSYYNDLNNFNEFPKAKNIFLENKKENLRNNYISEQLIFSENSNSSGKKNNEVLFSNETFNNEGTINILSPNNSNSSKKIFSEGQLTQKDYELFILNNIQKENSNNNLKYEDEEIINLNSEYIHTFNNNNKINNHKEGTQKEELINKQININKNYDANKMNLQDLNSDQFKSPEILISDNILNIKNETEEYDINNFIKEELNNNNYESNSSLKENNISNNNKNYQIRIEKKIKDNPSLNMNNTMKDFKLNSSTSNENNYFENFNSNIMQSAYFPSKTDVNFSFPNLNNNKNNQNKVNRNEKNILEDNNNYFLLNIETAKEKEIKIFNRSPIKLDNDIKRSTGFNFHNNTNKEKEFKITSESAFNLKCPSDHYDYNNNDKENENIENNLKESYRERVIEYNNDMQIKQKLQKNSYFFNLFETLILLWEKNMENNKYFYLSLIFENLNHRTNQINNYLEKEIQIPNILKIKQIISINFFKKIKSLIILNKYKTILNEKLKNYRKEIELRNNKIIINTFKRHKNQFKLWLNHTRKELQKNTLW